MWLRFHHAAEGLWTRFFFSGGGGCKTSATERRPIKCSASLVGCTCVSVWWRHIACLSHFTVTLTSYVNVNVLFFFACRKFGHACWWEAGGSKDSSDLFQIGAAGELLTSRWCRKRSGSSNSAPSGEHDVTAFKNFANISARHDLKPAANTCVCH